MTENETDKNTSPAAAKKPKLIDRVKKYQSEHPTAFAFSLIGCSVICLGLAQLLYAW
jgi:hypothetical protein